MSSAKPLPVRVRFAPSPTGMLHVGGMRSSLFNWLWARHTGGTFVLRLEDTDRTRFVEGAEEQILGSHDALGITPDEGPRQGGEYGPYRQSERLDIYHEHADKLIESGALYRCWCPPERLTELREAAQKAGVAFKYDRHCLIPENHGNSKDPHVLRFRIPDTPKSISWNDAVRGPMSFDTHTLDDFVAIKADDYLTYHFANVVDDHLMAISHVLRADEWLPSTPKHLLLFAAFGWQPPVYAHLPAVLGPSGNKKLSKRDGAQSVSEYIDEGYLPEALRSFLATLGWNDGTTQEVYATPELIERFTLERIQKSPAKLDKDRLTWVNGMMIRALWQSDPDALLERAQPFWPAEAQSTTREYKHQVMDLVQDRIKYLAELPELTDFFFTDPKLDAGLLAKTVSPADARKALQASLEALENAHWTEDLLEATIRPLAERLDLKTGQFFGLIRIAITGRTAAPGLFETLHTLGRDVTLRRLHSALAVLKP